MQETQETQVQSLSQEDPLKEEMADPLQYSGLVNPMEIGTWRAIVQGVTKSQHNLVTKHTHTLDFCPYF